MYYQTTATQKLQKLNKRISGVAGGTAASKTVSILILLINEARTRNDLVISVVSEFFPHLRLGAMRDFLSIMQTQKYFKPERWNKTDSTYTFKSGSVIEFFSADQSGKVRGPRRDILFLNEANNISYEVFTQLEIRTNEKIWLDWNPISEFWFYEKLKDQEDVDFITLTYKDNESLDRRIVKSIESKKDDNNFWRVYGLGQLGELTNKIYTGWRIIDKIPDEAKFEIGCLDFGYTNDPTACVGIYYYSGWYVLDEICYQTGLLNREIASVIRQEKLDEAVFIADSAEPKSIAELNELGIAALPSEKGRDSVSHGIQLIQSLRILMTKRSVNLIKEYRNYLWMTDKSGKVINIPSQTFNHCMDAIRYGFTFIEPGLKFSSIGASKPPNTQSSILRDPGDTVLRNLSEFESAKEQIQAIIPRSWK